MEIKFKDIAEVILCDIYDNQYNPPEKILRAMQECWNQAVLQCAETAVPYVNSDKSNNIIEIKIDKQSILKNIIK